MIPSFFRKRIKRWILSQFKIDYKNQCEYTLNYIHKGRAHDKVILVTGGTGAIGSAICYRMAIEGAIIGICGRSIEKINQIIDVIEKSYPEARLQPILLDVTDADNIEQAISDFVKRNAKIDVLVNNAGGGSRDSAKLLSEQDLKIIDRILDTNLRGSILCSRVASRYMIQQRAGKIINMSSVMGMNGKEKWTEYCSSKSGILGMTKALALELGEYNITVNSISPGMVQQTPFDKSVPIHHTHTNALKRFGYTDEVASLVAYMISDEANYITGQNLVVDGGRSIGLK